MIDRELMQQALDALESNCGATKFGASEALRARLAQPEPEPVAWQCAECGGTHSLCLENRKDIPLYTALPQREWQGLTDEEAEHIYAEYWNDVAMFIEAIEAKLKEKNG